VRPAQAYVAVPRAAFVRGWHQTPILSLQKCVDSDGATLKNAAAQASCGSTGTGTTHGAFDDDKADAAMVLKPRMVEHFKKAG